MHVCYQATRKYVIERRGGREEKRGRTGEKWKQAKRLGAKGRLDWENRVEQRENRLGANNE